MKYFYLGLALVYGSFAAVQYNDPDPYIWSPYYLVIAWICFQAFRENYNHKLTLVALIGSLAWAFSYLPNVVSWFKEGLPNIATSMKAGSPYIENMREFLGLVLCSLSLIFIVYKHHSSK